MSGEEKKDKQDRMIELLEEMLKWIKVTYYPAVKKLLSETLDTEEKKVVYQSSDGDLTCRQVAELAKVSHNTVSIWWDEWINVGIAEPIKVKGGGKRARKLFDLEDFGIKAQISKKAKEGTTTPIKVTGQEYEGET